MPATTRAWITGVGVGVFLAVALLVYRTIGELFSFGVSRPEPAELVAIVLGTVGCLPVGLPALTRMFHDTDFPRDLPVSRPPTARWRTVAAGIGVTGLAAAAVLALSANLAGQVVIRASLVAITVVGMGAMLAAGILPAAPSDSRPTPD